MYEYKGSTTVYRIINSTFILYNNNIVRSGTSFVEYILFYRVNLPILKFKSMF